MISKYFLEHPHEKRITYLQHLIKAWTLSFDLAKGAAALFIHGLIPGLFATTGSDVIQVSYQSIAKRI
jgi:hypothetical protein